MPRLETLFEGLLPVITNAPERLRLCTYCGEWKPEEMVTVWQLVSAPVAQVMIRQAV